MDPRVREDDSVAPVTYGGAANGPRVREDDSVVPVTYGGAANGSPRARG